MGSGANPFTNSAEVQGPLYATAGRLASRTSALHRARVIGRHAANVIAEIARCLTGDGTAVIAVKSADSYRELDRLMAASGLDPAAERRPSVDGLAHPTPPVQGLCR